MALAFDNNGVIEAFDQLPAGKFIYETVIKFPADFKIIVSGKDPSDTVIDDAGEIVADKHIKIIDVTVDGMACHPHYGYGTELHAENGQTVKSNYWGFNGTVKLNFSEQNSFFWALHSADA
jgi:hypothetical protein